MRQDEIALIYVSSRETSIFVYVSVKGYAPAGEKLIRIICNFLGDFWGGADKEIRKGEHHGILDLLRVCDQLIGGPG